MSRLRRRRMRGVERFGAWLLAPTITLLVPVTGFEAYALHTRLTPTTYHRGGAFQAGAPASSALSPGLGPTDVAPAPRRSAASAPSASAPGTPAVASRSAAASAIAAPAPRNSNRPTAPAASTPRAAHATAAPRPPARPRT